MNNKYELTPTDGRKSFYGKAYVVVDNQYETLHSYNMPIIRRNCHTNDYERLYESWSVTTGRHVKSFCGMNKKQFFDVPMPKEV